MINLRNQDCFNEAIYHKDQMISIDQVIILESFVNKFDTITIRYRHF